MNVKIISLSLLLVAMTLACGKVHIGDIIKVKASSELEPGAANRYAPRNLFDGSLFKSWVEGKPGDGIGEEVSITLNKTTDITSFQIKNGLGNPKYWAKNNRVKKLSVTTNVGFNQIVTLKDTPDLQTVKLNKPLKAKNITFTIRSVYRGTKYRDTAIAEIQLAGYELSEKVENDPTPVVTALPGPAPEVPGDCNVDLFLHADDGALEVGFYSEPNGKLVKKVRLDDKRFEEISVTIARMDSDWLLVRSIDYNRPPAQSKDLDQAFHGLWIKRNYAYSTINYHKGREVYETPHKTAKVLSEISQEVTNNLKFNITACKGKWVRMENIEGEGWISPEGQCATSLTACN